LDTYLFELQAKLADSIGTVLIRDSMLERLITTGVNTRIAKFPSSSENARHDS